MARNRLTEANATPTKEQQRRVTSEQFRQRCDRKRYYAETGRCQFGHRKCVKPGH